MVFAYQNFLQIIVQQHDEFCKLLCQLKNALSQTHTQQHGETFMAMLFYHFEFPAFVYMSGLAGDFLPTQHDRRRRKIRKQKAIEIATWLTRNPLIFLTAANTPSQDARHARLARPRLTKASYA